THYMDEAEQLSDDLIIVDQGKIVTRGTPKEIIAGLDAESVVSLVPAEGSEFVDESLRQLSGVSEVRREAGSIVLSVTDTQVAIAALYQHMNANDLALLDLHTHRATLEDVFVSLTGRHLRDD
ncbi:MAG: ABC-2 type transport system ATP-binding protein, partial [Planctomycetota bacterium]